MRDRREAGEITAEAAALTADGLERRLSKLIRPAKTDAANETFANHLYDHQTEVFTYLKALPVPGVPPLGATNYRAEQAIRPAVVNRKVWGGNRTDPGAHAQSVLMSVLRTAYLHSRNVVQYLSETFRGTPDRVPLLPPALASLPAPSG